MNRVGTLTRLFFFSFVDSLTMRKKHQQNGNIYEIVVSVVFNFDFVLLSSEK